MRVLVTGGAGYVGSVLVRELLERGYYVKCLDRFFFGTESVRDLYGNSRFHIIRDDIRWFDPDLLNDIDVVIDLAAISNDPSGELDPAKTFDINYKGRVRVAELCKKRNVKKYVLASSCSIYGFRDDIANEETPTNPLTTYARANELAENSVLPLSDSKLIVIVLRFATVYGLSQRMRFDLALNGMTLGLFKNGKIPLLRDGKQWRPFIHIKDVARAYIAVIENHSNDIDGGVFNVGSDEQNYRLIDFARVVGDSVGIPYEIAWYGSSDHRSYRVNFGRFKKIMNFDTQYAPSDAAREIYSALRNGSLADSPKAHTVDWYKHLMSNNDLTKEILINGTLL